MLKLRFTTPLTNRVFLRNEPQRELFRDVATTRKEKWKL